MPTNRRTEPSKLSTPDSPSRRNPETPGREANKSRHLPVSGRSPRSGSELHTTTRNRAFPGRESEFSDGAELVERWLHHLDHQRGRAQGTLDRYAATWDAFFEVFEGRHPFDVTLPEMERFTQRPTIHGGRRSNAAIKIEAAALRSFYTWADEKELTDKNLARALHSPTVSNEQPKPVPDDVWLRVVNAELSDSLRLALYLGYFTGLRRHEIAALQPSQVTPSLLVNIKRKGADADTVEWAYAYDVLTQELPELTVGKDYPELLLAAAESKSKWVIPWDIYSLTDTADPQALNKRMTTLSRRLTIEPAITPHMLRHSAATNLLLAGWDVALVSHFLNHSDIKTTTRYLKLGGGYLERHDQRNRRSFRDRVR